MSISETISADQWRKALEADKRRNRRAAKYGNKRVERNGVKYDSTGEADYEAQVLNPLRDAGKISYRRQVNFPFVINGVKVCSYRADWVVTWRDSGKVEVWDYKGYVTKEFVIKQKLMRALYGHEILLKKAEK